MFLSPRYFVTHEFSAKFRWGSTHSSTASVSTGRFRADYTIVRSGPDATREVSTVAQKYKSIHSTAIFLHSTTPNSSTLLSHSFTPLQNSFTQRPRFVHSTAKFLHSTPPDSFTPLKNSFTPRFRVSLSSVCPVSVTRLSCFVEMLAGPNLAVDLIVTTGGASVAQTSLRIISGPHPTSHSPD